MTMPSYDDGRIRVYGEIIETPTRLYPLLGTSVCLRRDPLWAGTAVAAFSALTWIVYGDLLHPGEDLALVGVAMASLLAGWMIGILRLQAPGQSRVFIVGRRSRMKTIYRTIASQRNIDRVFSRMMVVKSES